MIKRHILSTVYLFLFFFSTVFASHDAAAKDKLIMGVHPYKSVTELHSMFKPIADYISQKIGMPVELQFGKTYEDTANKLGAGSFDFCFISPTIYAKFAHQYNYKPLAQIVNDGRPSFYGVIVVKKGSGIKSIKDLKGKTFVFGDRNSTLTHVVPLYMLMNNGIHLSDLSKYSFVGSHDNVALNVAVGTFSAAGLMPDIAEKYLPQGLEVIAKSPQLPEHVFAAAPSLDNETVKKLQEAILSMPPDVYKKIKGSLTGLQKFNNKDFNVLRTILKTVEKELEK